MSMERIHQIKARLAAATPGPWEWYCPRLYYKIMSGDNYVMEATEGVRSGNDAEFIANAPTDIEFLLAEVDRLQKALNTADDSLRELADVL